MVVLNIGLGRDDSRLEQRLLCADETQGSVLIRIAGQVGVLWGHSDPQVHSRECSSAH